MTDVIEMPRRESAGLVAAEAHRFSAAEIRERVNLVQEVMRAVMKEGVHYGKIPGTPKPTLYKPGAEVLCVAFRIAPSYRVEDLSSDGVARFRVTCVGTHQVSGTVLGEGLGECSSAEEKYKWRKAICAEEFELTLDTMRRLKFGKGDRGIYKVTQIRTEAADQANTVLKMACKRAKVAMTLDVTAASDMFTQDIEDLPEELRPYEHPEHASNEPAPQAAPSGPPPCSDDLFAVESPKWKKMVDDNKKTPDQLLSMLSTRATFTEAQKKTILSWGQQPAAADNKE